MSVHNRTLANVPFTNLSPNSADFCRKIHKACITIKVCFYAIHIIIHDSAIQSSYNRAITSRNLINHKITLSHKIHIGLCGIDFKRTNYNAWFSYPFINIVVLSVIFDLERNDLYGLCRTPYLYKLLDTGPNLILYIC